MLPDLPTLRERLHAAAPPVDFCSLRAVHEHIELLSMRDGRVENADDEHDVGAMITVVHRGGLGYAATPDLSAAGLREAAQRAAAWAERCATASVFDFSAAGLGHPRGAYRSPVQIPWERISVAEKLGLLRQVIDGMGADPRLVLRTASLMRVATESVYLTTEGGEVVQHTDAIAPDLMVVAHEGGVTQRRSTGLRGITRQGGLERLDEIGFLDLGPRYAEEVLELLTAPDCPSGVMDLLLMPDQMMLQIHESIGHPLELDRILGDERNYAGTSFVTPDMFGSYRYGSPLLNVTFDPTVTDELASYAYDDDGAPARREHLIRDGVLVRPLGGTLSQARAGMAGVANSRATSWNRPPIDRMANLNVEPGDASFEALVGRMERGVILETNTSWSIDDSRNKFQFGCERGRLVENGQIKGVVKNPNYRGISATFWRNLAGVGAPHTVEVCGTPYCGKGEPNQVIRVGHASPACLFTNVDVFGGHQ